MDNNFKYEKISGFKLFPYTRPKYRLLMDFKYKTKIKEKFEDKFYFNHGGMLNIKKGYVWDGASGAIDKGFLKASLVHDVLCEAINKGQLDKKYQPKADKIMNNINKDEGMFFLRRWWTYYPVRVYQHFNRK